VSRGIGADSEVGRLRTVLMHRPGRELSRITPRTRDLLQLPALPWTAKAQQDHDQLTEVLRNHGIDVIYLTGLLQDVLEYGAAREEATASVLGDAELGGDLALAVRQHLDSLVPEDLALALTAGLTTDELRTGRGLVYDLLDPRDFVIEPLPNLVFTRDSSSWIGDQVIAGTLRKPRRRESDLHAVIYAHHPMFTGLAKPARIVGSPLDGGDVLLLGPGVVAVGVGAHTAAASAELLAGHLLAAGKANCVLAVPMTKPGGNSNLDLVCTVLGPGQVLMAPALAFTLTALTITGRSGELTISRPQPFLEAAARALDLDQVTMIGTGIESGQWDDGANALVIGDGEIICDERNSETNARLADAGFKVVTAPHGELGTIRGGPRAMCVPLIRDPARPQADVSGSNEHTIPPAAVSNPAALAAAGA
jgi:arginine deiminase